MAMPLQLRQLLDFRATRLASVFWGVPGGTDASEGDPSPTDRTCIFQIPCCFLALLIVVCVCLRSCLFFFSLLKLYCGGQWHWARLRRQHLQRARISLGSSTLYISHLLQVADILRRLGVLCLTMCVLACSGLWRLAHKAAAPHRRASEMDWTCSRPDDDTWVFDACNALRYSSCYCYLYCYVRIGTLSFTVPFRYLIQMLIQACPEAARGTSYRCIPLACHVEARKITVRGCVTCCIGVLGNKTLW